MRKLSLKMDELQVESFDTSASPANGRGTMKAYESDICSAAYTNCTICSGAYCHGETTAPCWAGTYEGSNCDSTGLQILCGCTYGGENNGTCDATCNSMGPECRTNNC